MARSRLMPPTAKRATRLQGFMPPPHPPRTRLHGKGAGTPPHPPGHPAYAQPLSTADGKRHLAFITDSNRPQPLWHPPPTADLTASGAASEVLSRPMHPYPPPFFLWN